MTILTTEQLQLAERTISSNAFYYIVLHHLQMKKSMSVVRMGDGESILLSRKDPDEKIIDLFDEPWLKRMGMFNLTYGELRKRLYKAGSECDYFAPSINGLTNEKFNLYKFFNHDKLVDNFFVNQWTEEQMLSFYDLSEGICLIHSNRELGDEMQRKYTRFNMSFVYLGSWEETDEVIFNCSKLDQQLVLFSGGCAGKYIAKPISNQGKVVIDVGNSATRWIV